MPGSSSWAYASEGVKGFDDDDDDDSDDDCFSVDGVITLEDRRLVACTHRHVNPKYEHYSIHSYICLYILPFLCIHSSID